MGALITTGTCTGIVFSEPGAHAHLYDRHIDCAGFLRDDGMWDTEGHLRDVRHYAFKHDGRGHVASGATFHEMWLRFIAESYCRV